MKKIVKIFLLLFMVLVITSCSNNGKNYDSLPTLDDSTDKIVGKYYTNIDCVYLPSWSEDSIEYETEMRKNRFIIKFSENCDYVPQPIKYKLDATTFSFTFNCKINESDLVKRYDVYEDGIYLNYSCFIDKYDNVYIAEISIDKEKVYNIDIMWRLVEENQKVKTTMYNYYLNLDPSVDKEIVADTNIIAKIENDSLLNSASFLKEFKNNLQFSDPYKYVDNLIIFAYDEYNNIVAIDTSGPKIQYYYLVMQDDNNIVTYQSYNSITELPLNKHS